MPVLSEETDLSRGLDGPREKVSHPVADRMRFLFAKSL